MAGKKTTGHDPATDRIVEVLERIEKRLERVEGEARATNERLERVETGLAGVREELHDFRFETRDELVDLRGEQYQLRELLKSSIEARIAKLEAFEPRVAKLEAVVFRPTGT